MILMEPMPSQKDEYFFIRFKNGDEHVFEMIFKSDYSHIIGFCWQFVRNIDKFQPLAQEAFDKLWLNKSTNESVNPIFVETRIIAAQQFIKFVFR